MEILKDFGINPVLLIAQIINFGVLFVLLKKLLYKPILKTIKDREDEIKSGLENAEKARLLIEETAEKERRLLKKANLEAQKFIDDAKNKSEEIILRSKEEAKKQADQILKDAKEQIALEAKNAQRQISSEITRIAIALIEKSLKNVASEKDVTNMIKLASKNIESKSN